MVKYGGGGQDGNVIFRQFGSLQSALRSYMAHVFMHVSFWWSDFPGLGPIYAVLKGQCLEQGKSGHIFSCFH